MNYWKKEKVT